MTRAELHSLKGFHPATLIAAALHLRSTMNRKPTSADATSLIRNEGYMNGYLDAVDALIAATTKQPEKMERAPVQPYSAPQNETPNKA